MVTHASCQKIPDTKTEPWEIISLHSSPHNDNKKTICDEFNHLLKEDCLAAITAYLDMMQMKKKKKLLQAAVTLDL